MELYSEEITNFCVYFSLIIFGPRPGVYKTRGELFGSFFMISFG